MSSSIYTKVSYNALFEIFIHDVAIDFDRLSDEEKEKISETVNYPVLYSKGRRKGVTGVLFRADKKSYVTLSQYNIKKYELF